MSNFFGGLIAVVIFIFYIAMAIGTIALPIMGLAWLFS